MTDRAAEARKMVEEARHGYQSLLDVDASNQRWALAAAAIHGSIGDVLLTLGMPDAEGDVRAVAAK